VSISTTPCMKINRISQEEQLAKQEARRRRKEEYFHTTPTNKIQVTQRNLEAYVQFYEKKLNSIVADMDSNIAKEKRKKEKLEGKLKKLLDANELLSKELAGIRRDLKKCHVLTETPV
jgi:pyruvate/2-oxoacid:ferredoxin oxidoreductase beta subunit